MGYFFHQIFYRPLYNALVVLSVIGPGHDLGLAIVLLTVIVKFCLWPLYQQSMSTQRKLKAIDSEIKKIKEKYKGNQTEQGQKLMALYKANHIHPLAGFFIILIQLPIILALYWVFRQTSLFPDPAELYSFVAYPGHLAPHFFGWFSIAEPSWWLAILTGLVQFWQTRVTFPPPPAKVSGQPANFTDDLSRSLHLQAKYVMPIIIALIAFKLPAALPLYWITSSLVMISQFYIDRAIAPKSLDSSIIVPN